MSLLVDMSADALDPAYAEAAARRGGAATGRHRGAQAIAALVAVGLATGIVAAQVRRDADRADTVRQSLVEDVQQRTRATDALDQQAAVLRADVSNLRVELLGDDAAGRALADEVARLELLAGQVAVQGPGLVVLLDDAPAGEGGDGRIFDRDIQDVVNALWAAGAEAIAINDQRVTGRTAIRSAGDAILVDLRPLSAPYRLNVVGQVDTLESRFVDSPTARRFQTWTSLYGLGFEVARASTLRLPAAPDPVLRVAVPQTRPGGSS